jgi:hypothetical protein
MKIMVKGPETLYETKLDKTKRRDDRSGLVTIMKLPLSAVKRSGPQSWVANYRGN